MFTVTRSECRRVARVLQAWLDGEAEASASARVVEHLETCRACGLDAATYLAIRTSLAAGGTSPVDGHAVDRLRHFADRLEVPRGMEEVPGGMESS
ncbi:MAG: zf-HC2 domain-containing protein [Actinomycetota bacterium]